MTVTELISQFSEIPVSLHSEPILETFVETFGAYLPTAVKPSACSTERTPGNHAYMTLVAPMEIHGFGLSTRERVVEQLQELIQNFEASVETFEDRMFERWAK